jgi:hypothetical protein
MSNNDSEVLFTHTLKENLDDFSQWRLTVTEFRGEQYLNIREYFLDFDSEWQPTKKGISLLLEMTFTANLLEGLKRLVSEGEQKDAE